MIMTGHDFEISDSCHSSVLNAGAGFPSRPRKMKTVFVITRTYFNAEF
jgi:hypothetical protein